mgnify:CR=1 FL=1
MRIGVPKEIKNNEFRVGLTPESVSEFVARGHTVLVETQAGMGIGAADDAYRAVGADIVVSGGRGAVAAVGVVRSGSRLRPQMNVRKRERCSEVKPSSTCQSMWMCASSGLPSRSAVSSVGRAAAKILAWSNVVM